MTLALDFLLANGTTTGVSSSISALIAGITVFTLAVFVGVEIITKIPQTLHTPLMSGSNAISGITVVGAIIAAGAKATDFVTFLGFIAIVLATVNVVAGFGVTHRMLGKFRRKN
jgi:H+-translocating NAD(P) transhydrogenase subunit alpha